MNIILKILSIKGIGFSIGWIFGMLLQLALFPLLLNEFKADANWWIPQLIGFTVTLIVVGLMNRKILFPWIKIQYDNFLAWLNK